MLLYGLISLFSVVNIFNVITSSIELRKRDFAELKSLGMSEKQINKMLLLEGFFYGIDAIIYGALISLVILYIMYLIMTDTTVYAFKFPILNMLLAIIAVYLVIFIAMFFAKKKIKKDNIVEVIRNENI